MAALPQIAVDLPIDPATFVSSPQSPTTDDAGGVEKLDSNGQHAESFAYKPRVTYGETIAAKDVLYLKQSDGKWWKADADDDASAKAQFAIAYEAGSANESKRVYRPGEVIAGLSLGNPTTSVAEALDQSQTTGFANTIQAVYNSTKCQQSFCSGDTVGNISRVDVYTEKVGSGGDLTVDIYALDKNGAKTGGSLGSKTVVNASVTNGGYTNFTFASAIEINPRTQYLIEITGAGSNSSNCYNIKGDTGSNNYYVRGGTANDTQAASDLIDRVSDIAFKTYSTLQRNYYYGDKIYLSNTAAGLSLNEGTNARVVGVILSSSSILFLPGFTSGELLGSAGVKNAQSIGTTIKFTAPRNCRQVTVYCGNGTSAIGECVIFKYGKTAGIFGIAANNLTASWSGNEISVTYSLGGTNTVSLSYYA